MRTERAEKMLLLYVTIQFIMCSVDTCDIRPSQYALSTLIKSTRAFDYGEFTYVVIQRDEVKATNAPLLVTITSDAGNVVYVNSTIILTCNAPNATDFKWTTGDYSEVTNNTTDTIIVTATSEAIEYTCIASDDNGNTGKASITVASNDIPECQNGLHNCTQKCIELEGGFNCACDEGYELEDDGISCTDIDECQTRTSRCQDGCINTIGGYNCTCRSGLQLADDQFTCTDINECVVNNGGCGQICNNTYGSYRCFCEVGYTLEFDGFSCSGQPCPSLMIRNGIYNCTGPQVTGTVCTFHCDHGYGLVGPTERECLSNGMWSESVSSCEILHCDELEDPENGTIVLPCFTRLDTACRILCSTGFYTTSNNPIQQCIVTDDNIAVWSEPPECVGVGVPRKYLSTNIDELNALEQAVNAIYAHGGGDCPELGMIGILNALSLSDSDSNVIVLTDASPKDAHRQSEVIAKANELRVSVHFFLSRSGCGDFTPYLQVASATEGIVVNQIDDFEAFAEFADKVGRFTLESLDGGSRKKRASRCVTYTVSIFIKSVSILFSSSGIISVSITNPSGTVETVSSSGSIATYNKENPEFGNYRMCSSTEFEYSLSTSFDLDFFVEYHYNGSIVSKPPAGELVSVVVTSSKIANISATNNIFLNLVLVDGRVFVNLLIHCGTLLTGEITYPAIDFEYQLEGFDSEGNEFKTNSDTKSTTSIEAPHGVSISGTTFYILGTMLELRCMAEGGSSISYTWTKNGGRDMFPTGTAVHSSTITIHNVTVDDIGNYTCTVSNDAGSSSFSVYVIIYVPLFDVSLTAPDTHVGESLTLRCSVNISRQLISLMKFVWSTEGHMLLRTDGVTVGSIDDLEVYESTYTIPQLSTNDQYKVYQCEVVIEIIPPVSSSSNTTLKVIVPIPDISIVPFSPIEDGMVGSPQEIHCTVSTVSGVKLSSVMISWIGPGGDTITNDSRVAISPTVSFGTDFISTLEFTYLMEGDEGTYTCDVMILETTTSDHVEIHNLTIPTTAGLTIIIHHNQIVGQLLTLECSVTTVRGITSRVEFIWSSSGTVLKRKEKLHRDFTAHYFDIYTDTYSIVPLSVNDDGRTYQCEVVFSARLSFVVDGNVTLDVIVPTPTVSITPSSPIQGAMVGSPQDIQCTVSTVSGVELSSVMISWMGPGGDTITNDSRVTISPTGSSGNNYTSSLQFMYLMEGDEGTYECNVTILETAAFNAVELTSVSGSIPIVDEFNFNENEIVIDGVSVSLFIKIYFNMLKYRQSGHLPTGYQIFNCSVNEANYSSLLLSNMMTYDCGVYCVSSYFQRYLITAKGHHSGISGQNLALGGTLLNYYPRLMILMKIYCNWMDGSVHLGLIATEGCTMVDWKICYNGVSGTMTVILAIIWWYILCYCYDRVDIEVDTMETIQIPTEILLRDNQSIMDIVLSIQPQLEQYIVVDELLQYLNTHQVLTKPEREHLGPQSTKTPTEKIRYLLSILESKSPQGQSGFVKALFDSSSHVDGHQHLIGILQDQGIQIHKKSTIQPQNNADKMQDLMDVTFNLQPNMDNIIAVDDLLPYFNRYKLVTKAEREYLVPQSNKIPTEKTRYLFLVLESKSPQGQTHFVKALFDSSSHVSDHQHLIGILREKGILIYKKSTVQLPTDGCTPELQDMMWSLSKCVMRFCETPSPWMFLIEDWGKGDPIGPHLLMDVIEQNVKLYSSACIEHKLFKRIQIHKTQVESQQENLETKTRILQLENQLAMKMEEITQLKIELVESRQQNRKLKQSNMKLKESNIQIKKKMKTMISKVGQYFEEIQDQFSSFCEQQEVSQSYWRQQYEELEKKHNLQSERYHELEERYADATKHNELWMTSVNIYHQVMDKKLSKVLKSRCQQ